MPREVFTLFGAYLLFFVCTQPKIDHNWTITYQQKTFYLNSIFDIIKIEYYAFKVEGELWKNINALIMQNI